MIIIFGKYSVTPREKGRALALAISRLQSQYHEQLDVRING